MEGGPIWTSICGGIKKSRTEFLPLLKSDTRLFLFDGFRQCPRQLNESRRSRSLKLALQNAIIRCHRAHAAHATLTRQEMIFEFFVECTIPLCGEQYELQRLGIQTLFPDHLGGPRDPIPLAKIVFLHASIVIFSSLPQQPSVQGGFGVSRPASFVRLSHRRTLYFRICTFMY